LDSDIPARFWSIPYNAARFRVDDVTCGANCQSFAYALLRHFGRSVSPLRSSELWDDRRETQQVATLRPLDLVLFNGMAKAFGAHVGVYLGNGRAIHLSSRVGLPAVWTLDRFSREPGYEFLVGAKRPVVEIFTLP
jgi:lipoprotein Spr